VNTREAELLGFTGGRICSAAGLARSECAI
jgi:hypothetical protein